MQKNIILILSLTLLFASCANSEVNYEDKINVIFDTDYEHSLISSGDNFPDFNPYKDSLDYYLICLHHNIPEEDIIKYTSFTDEKIDSINTLLIEKNWLKNEGLAYIPTIFIANNEDGKFLYEKSSPIAELIASKIVDFLPQVESIFTDLDLSQNDNFENWSFMILSNVLLDSWQIDNVENEFLSVPERPSRNNKNYYYSIKISNKKNEPFGIYGNQYEEVEDKLIGIYGNQRTNHISKAEQHFISKSDNIKLYNLANSFNPKLISILKEQNDYLINVYNESKYSNKINFEEFFIWWYHFIYTDVTNRLEQKGYLTIPKIGNFYYEIEND